MEGSNKVTWEDVDKAFVTGEVYNASNDVLKQFLVAIDQKGIPNEMVRHRAINRCITINTIINIRLAEKIDKGNTSLARINTVITIAMFILAAVELSKLFF